MINRLPWHKKVRTSAANNLDKINEVIDYINHSDISEVALSENGYGRILRAGKASSLKDLTVLGESIQNGTPTPENPVPVQVVEGRNLLPNYATSQTLNGVTFTVNADGSISARGTASAQTQVNLVAFNSGNLILGAGTYTLSGCPSGGSGNTYELAVNNPGGIGVQRDYGSSKTFTLSEQCELSSYIMVRNGVAIDATFYPQIEAGSTTTPYVPYGCIGLLIGDTVTPIDLQGNVLASLPDGTKDELKIDSAGHVVVEKRVLATPTTIDLGYIVPPSVENDDVITVLATITPEINASWWSYEDITELITDMKAYIDYKTDDSNSALGLHSIQPINIRDNFQINETEDLENIEDLEDESEE